MPRAPKSAATVAANAPKKLAKLEKRHARAVDEAAASTDAGAVSPYPTREHHQPLVLDTMRSIVDFSGEYLKKKAKQRRRKAAEVYSKKDMRKLEHHIAALERKIAKQRERIAELKRGVKRTRKPKQKKTDGGDDNNTTSKADSDTALTAAATTDPATPAAAAAPKKGKKSAAATVAAPSKRAAAPRKKSKKADTESTSAIASGKAARADDAF